MIIEFYGPAGAGKTTIAKAMANQPDSFYVTLNSRREKMYFLLIFMLMRPCRTMRLAFKVATENFNGKAIWRRLKFLRAAMAGYQKACSLKGKKAVLDRGFLQEVIFPYFPSVYESKKNRKKLAAWIGRIPRPDIVILVYAHEDIRIDRMHKRHNRPREEFGAEYARKWIRIMEKNYFVLRQVLRESDIPFIEVETDAKDANQIVEEIKQRLARV